MRRYTVHIQTNPRPAPPPPNRSFAFRQWCGLALTQSQRQFIETLELMRQRGLPVRVYVNDPADAMLSTIFLYLRWRSIETEGLLNLMLVDKTGRLAREVAECEFPWALVGSSRRPDHHRGATWHHLLMMHADTFIRSAVRGDSFTRMLCSMFSVVPSTDNSVIIVHGNASRRTTFAAEYQRHQADGDSPFVTFDAMADIPAVVLTRPQTLCVTVGYSESVGRDGPPSAIVTPEIHYAKIPR